MLDAKVMVTKAALAHQCAAWKLIFDKLVAKQRHPWLIVARAWDETVMTLSFSKNHRHNSIALEPDEVGPQVGNER